MNQITNKIIKSNIIFSPVVESSIPDSKPKVEYKRINLSIRNDDGTQGDLILKTDRLFSYGISPNLNPDTGGINGYTMPLSLWNQDGATSNQQKFTDNFEEVVEHCIDHLLENKDDLDQFDLTRTDLRRAKGGLNPFYWKREKILNSQGRTELNIIPGSGPMLYTKLMYSKKNDKFISQFFDFEGNDLKIDDILETRCHCTSAIKIESIFIGSKISLQIKMIESIVEPIVQDRKKRLLYTDTDSVH